MGRWGMGRSLLAVQALLLLGALSPEPCWAGPEPEPADKLLGSLGKSLASKYTKNSYCLVECASKEPHTLCKYPAGMGPDCKNGRSWPLTKSEREDILHAHNLLRNKMASGAEKPFPSATNMRQLEWDTELEQIAQRWADQCQFAHDHCRDTDRFPVGQNVAIYYSSLGRFPPIETRVKAWYDEIKDYSYQDGPFKFASETGHFTQVVWSDTYLIGCGRSLYEDKNKFPTQLLVCNYGPAGNVFPHPLYRKGRAASDCPGGKASRTYPALCAPTSQKSQVTPWCSGNGLKDWMENLMKKVL